MQISRVTFRFDDKISSEFKNATKKARVKISFGTGQRTKNKTTNEETLIWKYEVLTVNLAKVAPVKAIRGIETQVYKKGSLRTYVKRKLLSLASYDKQGIKVATLIKDLCDEQRDIIGLTKKQLAKEASTAIKEMSMAKSLLKSKNGVVLNHKKHSDIWETCANMRAHQTLLTAIKDKLPELEKLSTYSNGHWIGEDRFYRFYHQSFKVFQLQHTTETIVEIFNSIKSQLDYVPYTYTLKGKVKAEGLNEWFTTIVKEGTGKKFSLDSNKHWLRETRPILEAFFHAREFLHHMVLYGKTLDRAPCTLPSGWAAVLYLYNLR